MGKGRKHFEPDKADVRLCAFCTKPLPTAHAARVYCSDVCRVRARRARERGEEHCAKEAGTQSAVPQKSQVPKRTCHDCGKPTFDYRCADCWHKLRAIHDIADVELAHAV